MIGVDQNAKNRGARSHRLEEITFPVRSIDQNGKGIEIKLALLLSLVQERSVDALTVSMLHGVVDVALERLRASES